MKRIHGGVIPATVAFAGLAGCGQGEGESAEAPPMDFRIGNGDVDEDNDYPYVAKLSAPDSGCSGILISPGLVLTANHCLRHDSCLTATGVVDLSQSDWDINLGNGPYTDELEVDNAHSFTVTRRGVDFDHPVIERIGGYVSSCTKIDPSRDLAIMRLDERVPLSEITPMHVPIKPGYPSCDDTLGGGFDGTIVGFGDCGVADTECPGESDGHTPRTTTTIGGWGREWTHPVPPFETGVPFVYWTVDLPGGLYSTYAPLVDLTLGLYHGSLPGDSGGPLVTAESFPDLMPGAMPGIVGNHGGQLLCGVASRYYPLTPLDMYPPFPEPMMGNDYAAVDGDPAVTTDNDDWLAQHIIAADGNFIGECFAGDPEVDGTLELRDQDTDLDLIPDLCDPCPDYYDPDYNEGLAIGSDADADGVPDRCDNCAFVPNPLVVVGSGGDFARTQLDSDDDGYGNACDTCAESDAVVVPTVEEDDPNPPQPHTDYACCVTDADCAPGPSCPQSSNGDGPPPPPTNVCVPGDSRGTIIDDLIADDEAFQLCDNHCAFPVDRDCDMKGDLCDVCPTTFDPGQSDTDEDGVGDACDNCKGTDATHPEDVNPECDWFHPPAGDAFCQTLHPDSVCLPPHPTGDGPSDSDVSRCSLLTDPDGDGMGDTCDSCLETANPAQWNGVQKNCNLVNELVAGVPYPYIGDACDRNPCTSFTAFKQVQSEQSEEDRGWVAKIEYAPRLLPPWQEGHPYYGDPFDIACEWEGVHCTQPRATTGLRFCNCDELGADGKPDPLECQNDGCIIDSDQYTIDGNWWKPSLWPQLATINGGDGPYMSEPEIDEQQMINPVPGDPLGQGSLFPENTAKTSTAWWYTRNDIEEHAGDDTQLKGILWSHVTNVTYLLPTEAAAELEYRPWANHYKGGVFGPPPQQNRRPFLDLPMESTDYIYMGCPMDLIAQPQTEDEPTFIRESFVAEGQLTTVACRTMGGDVELGDAISTEARIALGTSEVRWVGASEKTFGSSEGMPALVALSHDGIEVGSILGAREGRIDLLGVGTRPGPRAIGRVGFGAALSAIEGSVFVIGGADAESGSLAGDVLRYDIEARTWSDHAIEGERPEMVLAATYRAQESALYVVDEVGGLGVSPEARLLRIDLSTGISTRLGQWPRENGWTQIFLANATDGRLLVVGSSSRGGYSGMAFDPAADLGQESDPSFLFFRGEAGVVVTPTMTEFGITMPVSDREIGVANTFLPMDALLEGAAVNGMALCL
jgi:hypothetical protein